MILFNASDLRKVAGSIPAGRPIASAECLCYFWLESRPRAETLLHCSKTLTRVALLFAFGTALWSHSGHS